MVRGQFNTRYKQRAWIGAALCSKLSESAPARALIAPMLVKMLALSFLLPITLLSAAVKAIFEATVPKDVVRDTFLKFGIGALYQAVFVSKNFRTLALHALRLLYGIQYDGKHYLDYTKLLKEHGRLMQGAGEKGYTMEAVLAINGSPDCACILTLLRDEFGYCMEYEEGSPPKFILHRDSLDNLYDRRRISVLPYVLDQPAHSSLWEHFISGLAALGRFDILNQMAFSNTASGLFYALPSVAVPGAVFRTAAEALQASEPTLELSQLLTLAGFGSMEATFPKNCELPLFLLQHLHENHVLLPADCVLVKGLEPSSISFWTYLCTRKDEEVEQLLKAVLNHGRGKSRLLASAFREPVSGDRLTPSEQDMFQAMLIRFGSRFVSNECIAQNCTAMLDVMVRSDFHTSCAFLDCQQYELLAQRTFNITIDCVKAVFIHKVYLLKDTSLHALLQTYVEQYFAAPYLLQSLIERKAEDTYVELVWRAIQSRQMTYRIPDKCCYLPIETLRALVFEPDMSIGTVQEMLSGMSVCHAGSKVVSRQAMRLYTAIFWGAPERIVGHFFDQISGDYDLEPQFVRILVSSPKYSSEFCRKLVLGSETMRSRQLHELKQIRPDLVSEPGS